MKTISSNFALFMGRRPLADADTNGTRPSPKDSTFCNVLAAAISFDGSVESPNPFLAYGNPHHLTVVDPHIAAHHRARLLKRQAKIEAAEHRRIHHEEKALAKAKRHESREEEAQRKKQEKERRRVEHDHRKEDDRKDREERQRVKEVQRARRRSLMAHHKEDAQKAAMNRTERSDTVGSRERRQRIGHKVPKTSATDRGVSWGYDPDIPDGGIEVGGPGKQAGWDTQGLGLGRRK